MLDDIGNAFDAPSLDEVSRRASFLEFLKTVGRPLIHTRGIYCLLAGNAPFLSSLMVKSNNDWISFGTNPLNIVCISLNPIREHHIPTILEKTYIDDQPIIKAIKTAHPEICIEEFSKRLYALTGGHPRTISDIKSP